MLNDLGLLILRLSAGLVMLIFHGFPKMQNFAEMSTRFPDPIGLGSTLSLGLAVFAEVFCAALLALGLFSRMALIPLIITMAVAFFIVHAADPFKQKELAFMFLTLYAGLFLTGPGKYSVQEFFKISAGRFSWLLK